MLRKDNERDHNFCMISQNQRNFTQSKKCFFSLYYLGLFEDDGSCKSKIAYLVALIWWLRFAWLLGILEGKHYPSRVSPRVNWQMNKMKIFQIFWWYTSFVNDPKHFQWSFAKKLDKFYHHDARDIFAVQSMKKIYLMDLFLEGKFKLEILFIHGMEFFEFIVIQFIDVIFVCIWSCNVKT